MPDILDHSTDCERLLGQPWAEVHAFLDQYFATYGPAHRLLLHHQLGVVLIIKRFGEAARPAAELHILRDLQPERELGQAWQDLLGEIPESWQDYGEPVLLDLALQDQLDQELQDLYLDLIAGEVKEATNLARATREHLESTLAALESKKAI